MTDSDGNRDADVYLIGATTADQEFIAHAREDIPRLLDEIARRRMPNAARGTPGSVLRQEPWIGNQ